MKIIHLMGGGDVGGAKTHIMSLTKELSKENKLKLISFRDGEFPNQAKENGIDVEVISTHNILKADKQLLKIVDEMQPDIIHCHGAKANLMGVMMRCKRKIPLITTVHSDYKLDYLGRPFKQYTVGALNAVCLRFMDFYQPVADRMARTLIARGFDPEKILPIYNGMDLGEPIKDFDRTSYCKEQWGIDINEDNVLCGIAARLTAVKDIFTTIRGFAIAVKEQPQLRLFLAGDGEDEKALRKLVEELDITDKVVFCGWVSPIDKFFAAMDITLLSSISETFPYSILEGIREGCVSVCSDVGGMSELIDSGENGYIFQPRDYETLGKQLAVLASDRELRDRFSKKLYEKASRDFSLKKQVETQMNNYKRFIAKFERRDRKKDGVVICGAYGKGNAGDDAILQAILQEMRSVDKEMPIWVMSRRPDETRLIYRTNAVYTFNILKVLRCFTRSNMYINGGGSLIQDVTSTRSLHYYLFTLRAAKKIGCKVIMYGCGIGPVSRTINRKSAGKTINKSVDVITLRDDNSVLEIQDMNITKPSVRLSADPTLILTPASDEKVKLAMENEGIPPSGNYIGFGLRDWNSFDEVSGEIAKAAQYAYEKHGLTPVFVPIEYPKDLEPAHKVAEMLNCPYYIVRQRLPIETTIGILSKMKTVVGIRLHSLMFSAGRGVPVIGLSYDMKVDGFLKYIGSHTCISLAETKAEKLYPLIDECVSGKLDDKVMQMAEMLRQREGENLKAAKELLNFPND